MPVTGVYCWINKVNGKVYVGSSSQSISGRLKQHIRNAKNLNCNAYLYRAIRKYGFSSFKIRVLEHCSPEDCVEREQYWIDKFDSANPMRGYNICPTAGSSLGYRHSQETLEKLAQKQYSEKTKRKMSEAAKGRIVSVETREKLKQAGSARRLSETHKQRIGQFHKGKKRSPEAIERMRLGWIKRKQDAIRK